MKRKDQISGAFWLLISVIVIQQSISLKVGEFRHPGPGLIPMIWGVALALLSIINMISASLRPAQASDEIPLKPDWRALGRLGMVIGILVAFTFVFPHMGFFFCSFWVLAFLFRDLHKRWAPFFAAGLTVIVGYLLFHVVLQIEFPRGPWGLQ